MNHSLPFDKLKESIKLCSIHHERMIYSYRKIQNKFPLDSETYENLSNDDLSYIDQLIFRFSKLQDSMGKIPLPMNTLFYPMKSLKG